VKALCLGARAVLIGRAYAYGMAAAGYPESSAQSRSCVLISKGLCVCSAVKPFSA